MFPGESGNINYNAPFLSLVQAISVLYSAVFVLTRNYVASHVHH